jgi:hypothetical protein
MWLFHANPPSDLDEVHVLYKRAVQLLDCGNGRAVLFRDAGERVSLLNRVVSRGRFLTGRAELLVDLGLHGGIVVSGCGQAVLAVGAIAPFPGDDLGCNLIHRFLCCRRDGGRCALAVAVESAVFDCRREVDVGIVHVDISADSIDLAFGRILPDAVAAGVAALARPLRHPDGEPLFHGVRYHGVQA